MSRRKARRAGTLTTFVGPVQTTQIAPTILEALGLVPERLQAVRIEGTWALPDLRLRPAH